MALDSVGKNALAGAGNTSEGLCKVELREILAIGNLAGESAHPPMLAHEQARIFGSGDRRSRTAAGTARTARSAAGIARSAGTTAGAAGCASNVSGAGGGAAGHLALPDRLASQLVEGHQHRVLAAGGADDLVTINQRRLVVPPHWQAPAEIARQTDVARRSCRPRPAGKPGRRPRPGHTAAGHRPSACIPAPQFPARAPLGTPAPGASPTVPCRPLPTGPKRLRLVAIAHAEDSPSGDGRSAVAAAESR